MASPRDPGARTVHVETVEQWRAWLAEHHEEPGGVWVVRWKPATGRPAPGYDPVIEEALAVGWIDGQADSLDDERSGLWVTHRRRGSVWSRLSKQRVARVEESGRMQPAGRAVVEQAKADGSWTRLDEVEDLLVPDDLAAALAALPGAREHFDAFTPGRRKAILRWLVDARTASTRANRAAQAAEAASRGLPAHQ